MKRIVSAVLVLAIAFTMSFSGVTFANNTVLDAVESDLIDVDGIEIQDADEDGNVIEDISTDELPTANAEHETIEPSELDVVESDCLDANRIEVQDADEDGNVIEDISTDELLAANAEHETIEPSDEFMENTDKAMVQMSQPEKSAPAIIAATDASAVRDTVLVLDNSVSMEGTPLVALKQSAAKFCTAVLAANGNNRVSVVSYDTNITNYCDFTNDIDTLTSVINSMDGNGSWTNINAGLLKADELLKGSDANIKNIIIMSDGVPTAGEYKTEGKYSHQDYSGTHNADHYCYEYANALYDNAIELFDLYSIYSLGFFHSMYADTKLFANRVLNDIQNAGYYEVTNVDDLEFTFDDIVDDILKRSGTFKFAGMLDHDSTATYYYDDNYFLADASIYNDHLATMSLCFELSTWSSNDGGSWTTDVNASDPKFKNARDLLIGTSDNNESGLEFSNFAVNPFWDGKPTKDSIGAVAAMKTIQNQQESHTLVALGVRGGGYGQEWSSNFTIGETGQHAGFAEAKQNVLDFLSQYITDNEITGNIKLWIVGYSRAGAVANLVAGAINDGYELPNDVKIAAKDLFAYTFEAPQGALTDQITGNHENIHNVINLNDVVPLVAPSAWNFVRYNTTNDIWLPSSYTSKNFKNQKDMMIRQYSKLEGGPSDLEHPGDVYKVKESSTQKNLKIDTSKFLPGGDPLWWWEDSEVSQAQVLLDAINFVANDVINSRNKYVTDLQEGVREIFGVMYDGSGKMDSFIKDFSAKLNKDNIIQILSPIWAFNLDSVTVRLDKVKNNISDFVKASVKEADLPVTDLFVESLTDILWQTLGKVANECLNNNTSNVNTLIKVFELVSEESVPQAHYPEICLAWLMSRDSYYNGDAISGASPSAFRVVHINCPVDVNVYDDNGGLVASIVDGEKQDVPDSSIFATVNINGEKLVYLPVDGDYNISIIPTDDGVMNYSINEVSLTGYNISRIVNYCDVPITTGEQISAVVPMFSAEEIESNIENGSSTEYKLLGSDNAEIDSTDDLRGEEIEDAYFDVTVSADSQNGYVMGSGTFLKGNFAQIEAYPLVGSSLIGWYEGETLISTEEIYRFAVTEDRNIVAKFAEVEKYNLNFGEPVGGSITNTAGQYTAGSQISIEAVPKAGYVFSKWSVDSGEIEDAKSASTWYTMTDSDATITAIFKKKSSGGGGGGGGSRNMFNVSFETFGGTPIKDYNVYTGTVIKEPDAPSKEDYVFSGWYSDKELTTSFDFSSPIKKNTVLYAKWIDIKEKQIILTIGKKEALVFGKIVENDVAPKVVNNRTMLPIRFIAEALGAQVEWNSNESDKVIIVKGDTKIVITIGSSTAIVDDKVVELDSPAFVENNRTYLPIRFVSEKFGEKVDWVPETQEVIITKQ